MPFRMSWGNIANMRTDAIVNAAYPTLRGGADGVHGEIFSAAGREALEAALAGIGWCDVGGAVVTPGFALHARHIIHAVGPQWRGGGAGERALLAQTYRRALSLAEGLHARSLAVPLLSTGSFGFPTVAAMDVAVAEIGAYLRGHGEMDITLVLDERWPHTLPDPMQGKLTRALRERYAEGAPELPLRPVGAQRYGACGGAAHDEPSTDDESPLWKAIVRDAAQRAKQRDGANGDATRDVPAADGGESLLWKAAVQRDAQRAKRRKALKTVLDALALGYALAAKAVSWPFRVVWQGLRAFRRWASEAARRRKPPPGAGGAASGALERDLSPTATMPHELPPLASMPPATMSHEPSPLASMPLTPSPHEPPPPIDAERWQLTETQSTTHYTGVASRRPTMATPARQARMADVRHEGRALQGGLLADTVPDLPYSAPTRMGAAEAGIADAARARSLREAVAHLGDTFSQAVLAQIDRRGLRDVDVYKRANLDRKLFSKLRGDPRYQPSKQTAVALCVALELNLDDTLDLLARAGYTLAACNKADLIAAYFIEHGIYDVFQLNEALFSFDQPCLGV